ncbi:DUF3224 domain-containing protein [Kordiimonas aestuarii]|uniref:DUF3224 domain-containing protein n=1 Tax=Kordiimonas aestuarii TaxID=1005925 RepID=UPI0021D0BCF3|nr:DUF3224 domain-containing protein [Kordiimonas aestuarii]
MNTVSGTFEVKLEPKADVFPEGMALNALSIDKQFSGPLSGSSKGMMISAMGGVQGSAGYVALEVVTGNLNGKAGTFALQHFGVMDRGSPSLTVKVVPDSGTGELKARWISRLQTVCTAMSWLMSFPRANTGFPTEFLWLGI